MQVRLFHTPLHFKMLVSITGHQVRLWRTSPLSLKTRNIQKTLNFPIFVLDLIMHVASLSVSIPCEFVQNVTRRKYLIFAYFTFAVVNLFEIFTIFLPPVSVRFLLRESQSFIREKVEVTCGVRVRYVFRAIFVRKP